MALTCKAFGDIITFTRASSATFTGSNGLIQSAAIDAPRFDYDPVTLAAKGLLIEEQRTNLLTYSEQFDNAAWTKTAATVTANATASPDGTTTAEKLIATAVSGRHVAFQSGTTVALSTNTVTCFAKAGEYNFLALTAFQNSNSSGVFYTFDLTNGSVNQRATGGYSGVSASAQSYGNGWWRCSITFTNGATSTADTFVVAPSPSATPTLDPGYVTASYTGDGTSGIFIWGAQLEAGSFATSYIPTVASQVTRSADVASVNTLSPWYNATEGTLYAEASALAVSQGFDKTLVSLSTGTAANTVEIYKNASTSNAVFYIANSSVLQAGLSIASTFLADVPVKLAGAYKTDDIAFTTKGTMPLTDSLAVIPTIDRLGIGSRGAFSSSLIWSGHIRRITYYPRRLSNAELQAITA